MAATERAGSSSDRGTPGEVGSPELPSACGLSSFREAAVAAAATAAAAPTSSHTLGSRRAAGTEDPAAGPAAPGGPLTSEAPSESAALSLCDSEAAFALAAAARMQSSSGTGMATKGSAHARGGSPRAAVRETTAASVTTSLLRPALRGWSASTAVALPSPPSPAV